MVQLIVLFVKFYQYRADFTLKYVFAHVSLSYELRISFNNCILTNMKATERWNPSIRDFAFFWDKSSWCFHFMCFTSCKSSNDLCWILWKFVFSECFGKNCCQYGRHFPVVSVYTFDSLFFVFKGILIFADVS